MPFFSPKALLYIDLPNFNHLVVVTKRKTNENNSSASNGSISLLISSTPVYLDILTATEELVAELAENRSRGVPEICL